MKKIDWNGAIEKIADIAAEKIADALLEAFGLTPKEPVVRRKRRTKAELKEHADEGSATAPVVVQTRKYKKGKMVEKSEEALPA